MNRHIFTPSVLMLVLAAALILSGCAAYQHRLVEPSELAGAIDAEGVSIAMPPLKYHASSRGERLQLRIVNPTSDPITLLGERSYLIDPLGETRTMTGGTIAPDSYITLLLPPEIATVRSGPRIGVGVGVGTGRSGVGVGGGVMHDPWARHPTYVRDASPVWRWGTGEVRVLLTYERADERFEHQLAFEREKVN